MCKRNKANCIALEYIFTQFILGKMGLRKFGRRKDDVFRSVFPLNFFDTYLIDIRLSNSIHKLKVFQEMDIHLLRPVTLLT